MVPSQEANGDTLGIFFFFFFFDFLHNNCMLSVLIRIALMRRSRGPLLNPNFSGHS